MARATRCSKGEPTALIGEDDGPPAPPLLYDWDCLMEGVFILKDGVRGLGVCVVKMRR